MFRLFCEITFRWFSACVCKFSALIPIPGQRFILEKRIFFKVAQVIASRWCKQLIWNSCRIFMVSYCNWYYSSSSRRLLITITIAEEWLILPYKRRESKRFTISNLKLLEWRAHSRGLFSFGKMVVVFPDVARIMYSQSWDGRVLWCLDASAHLLSITDKFKE